MIVERRKVILLTCMMLAGVFVSCKDDSVDEDVPPTEEELHYLLKTHKGDDYEIDYEYDDRGRVKTLSCVEMWGAYEEKHNASYNYDNINDTIHISDVWTRTYTKDPQNISNPWTKINAELTAYIDHVHHRIDSIVEYNSTIHDPRNRFIRYFAYDDDNHLVSITNRWNKWKYKILWGGDDIVSGEDEQFSYTFTPSNVGNMCPAIDSRVSYLSILDRPLLIVGLFGKAPKHLERSREIGGYRIDYDYDMDGENIVRIGVSESKDGNIYKQTTESFEWQVVAIP